MPLPTIAITTGEPAGIGPDIVLMAAQRSWPAELVVIADPDMLRQRALALQLPIELQNWEADVPPQAQQPGTLKIHPVALAAPAIAGRLNTANAPYVLADTATGGTGLRQRPLSGHGDRADAEIGHQ